MNLKSYVVVSIVVASLVGAGAFSQSASAQLSDEINIGLLLPISGDASSHGEENREAAKLAIIDFNQYLADKGAEWSLVMTIEDTQTQPTVALDKIQSLHAKGIKVIVGPYASANLQNIKGYADNNDMVVVSCCSTSPLLAIEGDRIFRMSPDDTNQGVVLARLMADAGIEIAVPVWREDAWGSELAKSARAAFTNIGGEVTDGLGYNPETAEFSVSASLVAAQVQDAVDRTGSTDNVGVLFMGFGEIAIFMQSASSYEILPQVQWFGADPHSRDPELVEDPIALQFVNDTEFSAVQVASGKNEFSDRVVAGVSDVLGREPSTYASSTYDAVWVVGLAIEKTQGANVDAITAEIPVIADEHIGALGSTKLNAAGDLAQTNYDIWHIMDNQWILRGVYFSATDSIALEDTMMMEEKLSGEIEIGSIIPLTGKLARSGEENKIGYELAVDHFNAYLAEKDAGWSFSVVSEDSQTQPTVTLEKVQALNAKGIKHVIGPQSSGNIQNIKGYVDSNNIMIISPSSTSPLLAIGDDSIFRLAPDDSNQAVALVRLLQDAGIEVIVPIWRDEAWGVGLESAIREAFSAAGGTVHEGIAYSPEASDFSSEASLLAEIVQGYVDEHGADKVGVASFGFGETQILFQSAASHDILDDVRWFGADAVTKDTVIIDDQITLEFATATEFTTLQVASGKNDISKQVEEAVEEAIGRTPRTYASSAYDAIWLLGLSMERIQSTDVAKLTAVFPEVAAEHSGALGSTKLNENGDLAQVNYDVWTISDGQWVQLGVYFASSDSIELAVIAPPETEVTEVVPETEVTEVVPETEVTDDGGCLIATAAYGASSKRACTAGAVPPRDPGQHTAIHILGIIIHDWIQPSVLFLLACNSGS